MNGPRRKGVLFTTPKFSQVEVRVNNDLAIVRLFDLDIRDDTSQARFGVLLHVGLFCHRCTSRLTRVTPALGVSIASIRPRPTRLRSRMRLT